MRKEKFFFSMVLVLFCFLNFFYPQVTVNGTNVGITFDEGTQESTVKKEEPQKKIKKRQDLPQTGEIIASLIMILLGMMLVMTTIGIYLFNLIFYENYLQEI